MNIPDHAITAAADAFAVHRWKSMGVSVLCECGEVIYDREDLTQLLTQFPADEAFRRHLAVAALAAAAPAIREAERQRIRHDLLDGDPGKLERAFREFVDPEEAADCVMAVTDLLGDG